MSSDTKPVRILIVDDYPDTAAIIGRLLTRQGHEVYTAHDGADAVRAAETHRPAVVLLDINLPVIDGYDVARQIREQPWANDVVLIAHTGLTGRDCYDRCVDAGFNFQLSKPAQLKDLAQAISLLNVPSIAESTDVM